MKAMKSLLTLIAALTLSTAAHAAAVTEGVSYKVISPAQATTTEGKIEVVEIFSYLCSHCHRFEPIIERWLKSKPDNIEFVRMPAIFKPNMALYARAFYAAEALDALEKFHQPMFDAVHMEKRRLQSEDEIADLAAENGIDRKKFLKAMRSPYVTSKVNRATELSRRYGIEATPSMVINGKYRTNPGMGRIGFDGMLEVVNALAEKEHKAL